MMVNPRVRVAADPDMHDAMVSGLQRKNAATVAGENNDCDVVKRDSAAKISTTMLMSPLISKLSVGMRRRRSGGVWRGGMAERLSGLGKRRKRVSAAVRGSSLVDMTSIRCCRWTPDPHITSKSLMRMAMERKYPLLDTMMTFKSL